MLDAIGAARRLLTYTLTERFSKLGCKLSHKKPSALLEAGLWLMDFDLVASEALVSE